MPDPPPPLYLKLMSIGSDDLSVAQPFLISFELCSDQPIAFYQHTSVFVVQDRNTYLTKEFDMIKIFHIHFEYPRVCTGYEFWLTDELDRRLV